MLREVALDAVLLPPAEGRVGEDDVDAVGLGVADVGPGQGVVVADEAGILDAVQQHVGDAEHVRKLLFLHRAQGLLHLLLVLGLLHVALAHVADGAGEEAAGAAGRVEEDFAGLRVDAVRHEGGDGARRVVLAGVAGALEVVEDLLVDVAEVLALGEVVEVDLVDLVDHLAHELAGLHVVVGVLEDVAHDAAAVARLAGAGQFLEPGKELVVDEVSSSSPVMPSGSAAQARHWSFFGDGRAVAVLHQFQFLILVVDDLEEEHPAELGDALGVAIDADVLAHDVLDGFDGVANGHGVRLPSGKARIAVRGRPVRNPARPPNCLMSSIGVPMASKGGICRMRGIVEVDDAFVLVFLQQGFEHGAGLRAVLGEDVALADVVGPLAAGERRLVEGDVADEVEGIEVLADFLGERVERQAFGFQFLDDGLLALGGVPAFEEIVQAGEALLQGFLGVVAQAFGDQLAVLVEVFDALGDDAGADAIDVDLLPAFRRR